MYLKLIIWYAAGSINHKCHLYLIPNRLYIDYCGDRIINVDRGSFSSPGYPNDYPANLNCEWQIKATSPSNGKVVIRVQEFSTDEWRDVVNVEGRTFHGDASRLFRLQGTTKVRGIIFNSSEVTVSMTSNSRREDSGFLLALQSLNDTYSELSFKLFEPFQPCFPSFAISISLP